MVTDSLRNVVLLFVFHGVVLSSQKGFLGIVYRAAGVFNVPVSIAEA